MMRRIAVAALFGLTLCASVHAHDSRRSLPEALLEGIVQERDVSLLFGYLREALTAAMEGRETAAPEELAQRAEAIGAEVKRRGAAAAHALIDAVEAGVRERLRDLNEPKAGRRQNAL